MLGIIVDQIADTETDFDEVYRAYIAGGDQAPAPGVYVVDALFSGQIIDCVVRPTVLREDQFAITVAADRSLQIVILSDG